MGNTQRAAKPVIPSGDFGLGLCVQCLGDVIIDPDNAPQPQFAARRGGPRPRMLRAPEAIRARPAGSPTAGTAPSPPDPDSDGRDIPVTDIAAELQDNGPSSGSTPAEPELLERGRYAITGMPDGSWVITRAGPLCETCTRCGCGEQQEPMPVPAIAVQAMTGQLNGAGRKMLAKLMGRISG